MSGITIQEEGSSCCSGCITILSALIAVLTKDSPDTALDKVEVCTGSSVKAKEDSQKVFLLGDCAISANKDRKDAVLIKGCPPPVVNSIMAMVLKSYPRRKVAKVIVSRMTKQIGTKLGVYREAFPAFGICEPPEFDRKHF